MHFIADIRVNDEQIRLNLAAIAFMRAGYGAQTRDDCFDLRDDTAASIAWLRDCNAGLYEANAILRSAR